MKRRVFVIVALALAAAFAAVTMASAPSGVMATVLARGTFEPFTPGRHQRDHRTCVFLKTLAAAALCFVAGLSGEFVLPGVAGFIPAPSSCGGVLAGTGVGARGLVTPFATSLAQRLRRRETSRAA